MEPPKCRICGGKHWSSAPHVLPGGAKPPPLPVVRASELLDQAARKALEPLKGEMMRDIELMGFSVLRHYPDGRVERMTLDDMRRVASREYMKGYRASKKGEA